MEDKKNYIINGKNFLINPYGDIVDEGGYIKYADEFTEEELKSLPPCPGKKTCFKYFNVFDNEWKINPTIW